MAKVIVAHQVSEYDCQKHTNKPRSMLRGCLSPVVVADGDRLMDHGSWIMIAIDWEMGDHF
jgi:hypothetical protein